MASWQNDQAPIHASAYVWLIYDDIGVNFTNKALSDKVKESIEQK
jgi:hypothetical protein